MTKKHIAINLTGKHCKIVILKSAKWQLLKLRKGNVMHVEAVLKSSCHEPVETQEGTSHLLSRL